MGHLFIDSTYDLTVGLLSDELGWKEFRQLKGMKASAVVQKTTHEILSAANLELKDLKSIITVNGPGFYTGLRLAEGFSDVLKFFGIPQYSFYSYEVPLWCGIEEGTWFTKAYRGEYFVCQWKGSQYSSKLISTKELSEFVFPETVFIHSDLSLDDKSRPLFPNIKETLTLVSQQPKIIMSEVLKGASREPFYFRAPEDEFKVNP